MPVFPRKYTALLFSRDIWTPCPLLLLDSAHGYFSYTQRVSENDKRIAVYDDDSNQHNTLRHATLQRATFTHMPQVPQSHRKIVSMIRKYHNHKLQTTPWHREEEPLNHHETLGRQIKQSNQLSLSHQDDCNTKLDIK